MFADKADRGARTRDVSRDRTLLTFCTPADFPVTELIEEPALLRRVVELGAPVI